MSDVDLNKVLDAISDALGPLTMEEQVRVLAAAVCLTDTSLAMRSLRAFIDDVHDDLIDPEAA